MVLRSVWILPRQQGPQVIKLFIFHVENQSELDRRLVIGDRKSFDNQRGFKMNNWDDFRVTTYLSDYKKLHFLEIQIEY